MTENARHFVFLEIQDLEINNLLCALRSIFFSEPPSTVIHTTVQGPLAERPSAKKIEERFRSYLAKAKMDYILLNGVRHFSNENFHHVGLAIDCEPLRKVWLKPDFPDEFNPHITLYSGSEEGLALQIQAFLTAEIKPLMCRRFIFTSYKTKQPQRALFSALSNEKSSELFPGLIDSRKVSSNILEKAKKLRRPYRIAEIKAMTEEMGKLLDSETRT